MADPRVIIVGAGPAGIRAAETLLTYGLVPILIDENERDGGQIYRRPPDSLKRSYKVLYGTEAERAAHLHSTFEQLRCKIDYRPNTLGWNVANGSLHVVGASRSEALGYDALVIATGATDRLMPVKGWDLAGVYSLGGAQIAIKAQACSIGRKVAFLGTGPLLYLTAAQYLKAGANVVGVFDTSPISNRLRALPKLLARPATLRKGIELIAALRRQHIPIETGIEPIEIGGETATGVNCLTIGKGQKTIAIACDAVALGYHLRAEALLADSAHCEFSFDELTRQWLPIIDRDGRATIDGIYLAGDGVRLTGADGAELSGELAALAAMKDMGRQIDEARLSKLRRELAVMDRFRTGLAEAFPWPFMAASKMEDDTVVCRCELVTAGQIRRLALENGATEINRNKAFGRAGMGRCQGRYCGHAIAEVIAAVAGIPINSVGRLRGQAPIKPLAVNTLSSAAPK